MAVAHEEKLMTNSELNTIQTVISRASAPRLVKRSLASPKVRINVGGANANAS